jgi:hypothetical protein
MRSSDLVLHLSLIALLAAYVACSSDDNPAPPATADSGTTVDAGGSTDTGAVADTGGTKETGTTGDGGKKAFGEDCNSDGECESNACFMGNGQQFCSLHCTANTAATDCPVPPTTGECNPKGFCRKP